VRSAAGALVDAIVDRGDAPAVALVAVDRDGVVDERYAGTSDRGGNVPIDAGTRFALASLTKPLVAMAALVAVEEGIVELDAPLAGLLPDVHPQVTLRGCLAHTSGLPESVSPALLDLPAEPEWPLLAAAYCRVPPELPAGERRRYSNVGYAIAGAALEAASGMAVDRYVREAVLAPLGVADECSLGLPAGADAAWVRDPGLFAPGVPAFNTAWFRAQPLPQSNGFATARAYARVLQVVLRGGVSEEGVALLAPETCAELLANQGGALPGGVESFMTWDRADWALGFELRDAKPRHWTGSALTASAGTHFGASGALCFVDPGHGIAAAVLANRGTYSGWMLRPGCWPDVVAALVGSR
jgi:CubicO group peptidase (beta-lactamase class C family)